ncbi:mannose-1-phosphate guanylyltransferase [Cytophagales bacterium LB-30]|uniref:Mannose-1-phosphate guanylyltransferase n=1 Tax=Shiella aurantiaca TaxID=3058365 RepID=A0ABT8F8W7_9BACT|nr:mannose-1-phosphate guanylyltransferase [Shiella aurantiaca]MDN4166401.1 mannose-1-phosphate guanylyltransferase [Shiella aurantiaca]
MQNTFVVIMAGGLGTRFWPYSRTHKPKQFLDVLGTGSTLLQMTYERFKDIALPENILVVTHESYKELVMEQLPFLTEHQILLEPARKNTAPCIAYASYKIKAQNPEATIVVTPADHLILKEEVFRKEIQKALRFASAGNRLVTLGITPSRPDTGYGYIQFETEAVDEIHQVVTFTEKPEKELAIKFLESGDFVWNAGIFIWHVSSILAAFEEHLPDMVEVFEAGLAALHTPKEQAFIAQAYSQCKNISIDYGVMEKADNVYVVKGDFGWSDLGSWNALHEISEKDADNNVVQANGILMDTKNSYVIGPAEKLILVQGLEGYLVAECDNVLLICRKDLEGKFREFINVVKEKKGNTYL